MNSSLRFFKPRFKKSHMTPDIVYVPINWLLQFWIQNLMQLLTFDENRHYDFLNRGLKNLIRLLMFHELVITISSELKSGFQLNHGNNNK